MPSQRKPRVLVTRASHQASELVQRLQALGLEPVLLAVIEIVEPTSFKPLDGALSSLESFHWLIFTSANAVHTFSLRLPAGREVKNKIAAIGPSTARSLKEANLNVSLIPPQAIAESLTETLLPHARQPNGAPTRFLLVRAEEAREHLPETLRSAGAEVTIAPAYRTVIPQNAVQAIQQLFANRENWPDAITFASSSTARNLLALCEAASVELPEPLLRVSIGPITSRTLQDLGYPPHAESPQATVAALAATVIQALRLC